VKVLVLWRSHRQESGGNGGPGGGWWVIHGGRRAMGENHKTPHDMQGIPDH